MKVVSANPAPISVQNNEVAHFLTDVSTPLALPKSWPQADGTGVACGQPTIANAAICRQVEKRILSSTVQFRIDAWLVKANESGYEVNVTYGHATLKDDSYLVTHNHFSVPLPSQFGGDQPDVYAQVILANSSGEALFKGPLSEFEAVWEDPETLVITHQNAELFQKLGFASADFQDWSSTPLATGMEVAQVDWDGATTRVDWTTIQEVHVEDGVPRLVLGDAVTLGASGGGIFWNGDHVGNNWLQVQHLDQSGQIVASTTKVALNSVHVADATDQALPSG